MTVNDNELLSALIDGELDATELDRALTLLDKETSAKDQLLRYQQHSDLVRGYTVSANSSSLTQSISKAIESEVEHSGEVKSTDNVHVLEPKASSSFLPDWFWQQAMGMAIAASIGALAVVGIWQQPDSGLSPIPLATLENDAIQTKVTTVAHVEESAQFKENKQAHRWTVSEPEVADRLNTYLVDHNEYAGTSDVFSNARVIAYEVE